MKNNSKQKLNSLLMIVLLLVPSMFFGHDAYGKDDIQTRSESTINENLPPFTSNLSAMALEGVLNYAEGFEKETEKLVQSLSSKKSVIISDRNRADRFAVLYNAAIQNLATKNAEKNQVWMLDMNQLIASSDSNEIAVKNLESVLHKVADSDKNISLFIEDASGLQFDPINLQCRNYQSLTHNSDRGKSKNNHGNHHY